MSESRYSIDNLVADPAVGRVVKFVARLPFVRRRIEGVVSLGVTATKAK